MKNKKIFIIICVIFFVALFLFSVSYNNSKNNFVEYDNYSLVGFPHFTHSPITYSLDVNSSFVFTEETPKPWIISGNDSVEKSRIKLALEIVENSTEGLIKFKEVKNETPDIYILGVNPYNEYCDNLALEDRNKTFRENGFGGIINSNDKKINQSIVIICSEYYLSRGWIYVPKIVWGYEYYKNEFPNTEIHEILHALGFGHIEENCSLMNPILNPECNRTEIDTNIVSCLKYIYSNGEVGSCNEVNFMFE